MIEPGPGVADVDGERDKARRLVKRLTAMGALLVPAGCPFTKTSVQILGRALLLGELKACPHRTTEPAAMSLVPTYGPLGTVFRAHCWPCFEAIPTQLVCQVCTRTPSPRLRTIVYWDRSSATLLVGRVCRDCRPGLVA